MRDFRFDFFQARELLKNPNSKEIFEIGLQRLSALVEELSKYEPPTNENKRITFNNVLFSYSVNPPASVLANLDIEFENCTFLEDIYCDRFTAVNFSNCKIEKLFMTDGGAQLNVRGGYISHLTTHWHSKGAHCFFEDVKIDNLLIQSPLEEVFFTNCTFVHDISCKIQNSQDRTMHNLYFKFCTFDCAPDFMGCDFSKCVNFNNCKFTNYSESMGKYHRDLKHKMINNQDELSASFFGGIELKTKHEDLEFGIEYCLSQAYSWLSDHGLDPFRPVKILGQLAICAFLIWGTIIVYAGPFLKTETTAYQLNDFMQMIYLSFISVLGPLRLLGSFNLLKIDTFEMQLVLWSFTCFASLLWFFIILAVRKRFKVG